MKKITRADNRLNRILGTCLIVLIILVSLPLTIKTFRESGGPWGFGIVGLQVLLPLDTYFVFGIVPWIKDKLIQRQIFIAANIISLSIGLICSLVLSFLPGYLVVIPLALATISILDKKHFPLYLGLIVALAILANLLLLKWELDFGRDIPFFQLLESSFDNNP